MANVGNLLQYPMGIDALMGILIGLSDCRQFPARPWPLIAACESAAAELPTSSPLGSTATAMASWGEYQFEEWLRGLGTRGHAWTQGRGISACWVVSDDWIAHWRLVAESLPTDEAHEWQHAAQSLTNCVSIWEKTVEAAVSGSGPSLSGI